MVGSGPSGRVAALPVPPAGPAHSRQDGEGHQEGEPVVVDLAVREGDIHPLEVEQCDHAARQTRHPVGSRDQSRQHQRKLDALNHEWSGCRERQQASDQERPV